MMSIKWDEELAMTAQRWADQCNFGHDVSRDVERFAVGQNIFEAGLPGGNVELEDTVKEGIIGVNGWYSEVAQFDGSGVDNYK